VSSAICRARRLEQIGKTLGTDLTDLTEPTEPIEPTGLTRARLVLTTWRLIAHP
jgi:hypothetical protein